MKKDAQILIRLPAELKEKLDNIVTELKQQRPEGNYTMSSIIRAATVEKIEELENELAKNK